MPLLLQNIIEIANTAVEMLLIFVYFSLLSKRRRGNLISVLSYVLTIVALSVSVLMSDNNLVHFAATICILVYVAFVVYIDSLKHRLFWISIYLLIISLADPIVIGILCIANMGTPEEFLQSGIGRYLGMIGTDIIYLWLIGLMHRIINKRVRDIPVQYWILILVIPVFSIFILQFMIKSIAVDGPTTNYFSLSIALLGIIYINVAMFRFFESFEDKIKIKYMETLKQQEEDNYKLLALSYKQVREFKHDIENQFSILNDLLDSDDVEAAKLYLVNLGSFVQTANRLCYTGSNPVDSIVNIKGALAQTYGIEFICKINIITSIRADEVELCRIIGNGLDNAIEGCQRADDLNKHIFFSLCENRDKLIIVISNTSDKVDVTALSSTKKEKGLHGIGISSIKSSAERLNGLVKFGYTEGVFKMDIVIQNFLSIQ